MISFFRKVRKSIHSAGATNKYLAYAIGEILLVMIGILLALQVNNWNENRKDRQKENILLGQLHEEFLANKDQLEMVTEGHKRALMYCEKMIDLFPIDPDNVNLDSIQYFLVGNAILNQWTFNPSNATVNALSSDGSFEIISNDTLRIKLMSWKAVLDDYIEDQHNVSEFINIRALPYIAKNSSNSELGIKDPRLNLDFLTSIEFENIIYAREYLLKTVLSKDTLFPEYNILSKAIDDIIELTHRRSVE